MSKNKFLFLIIFSFSFQAAASPLAIELSKQLLAHNNSFVFSPVSLEVALSMTAEGANNKTAQQFKSVLALPLDNPKQALSDLNVQKEDVVLTSLQKIWIQNSFPTLEAFKTNLKENYNSEITNANFESASENERKAINTWVEQSTQNKIKDLIPKNGINSLTKYVLVNALYLKAKWLNEFKKSDTLIEQFHSDEKTKVKVHMMKKRFEELDYYDGADFSSILLPFISDDLVLQIFLPKKLSASFDLNLLNQVLDFKKTNYAKFKVNVKLPKFKSISELALKNYFKNMGLQDPFSLKADFSKLSPIAVEKGLRISEVYHKAFFEIDEEGGEAAAASASVMAVKGMMNYPKVFFANQPFLYFIKKGDQILFLGYFKGT